MKWAGAALLLAALGFAVGCSKSDPAKPAATSPAAQEKKEVVILTWDEYFNDEVLEEFTSRTGI
jgi:spermidine/putrescine-binding protein